MWASVTVEISVNIWREGRLSLYAALHRSSLNSVRRSATTQRCVALAPRRRVAAWWHTTSAGRHGLALASLSPFYVASFRTCSPTVQCSLTHFHTYLYYYFNENICVSKCSFFLFFKPSYRLITYALGKKMVLVWMPVFSGMCLRGHLSCIWSRWFFFRKRNKNCTFSQILNEILLLSANINQNWMTLDHISISIRTVWRIKLKM